MRISDWSSDVCSSDLLASVNTTLHKNLPYNTLKDFTPISMIAKFSMVLAVNPEKPFKTVTDLVDAARANPNALSYGSAGNASTAHQIGTGASRGRGLQ